VLVALYGCETWSLTLREEHRLRMFMDRILRRIFGPKRDEVTGECRKLDNDSLNDMYSSPTNVQVITWRIVRWPGHVACMGKAELYTGLWWCNLWKETTWKTQEYMVGRY